MSAIPPEELPILESLIKCVFAGSWAYALTVSIRNRLTALKKLSAEDLRPNDVQAIYNAVIKQGTWGAETAVLTRQ